MSANGGNAGKTDDEIFVSLYPWIQWGEPLAVHRTDGVSRFVCRLCVAKGGLRARDLKAVGFDTRWEFEQHLKTEHADVVA